jgi:hypothetical protein
MAKSSRKEQKNLLFAAKLAKEQKKSRFEQPRQQAPRGRGRQGV